MKKFFITLTLILTTITGLFAEEKKWNVEYRIQTVTPDEFYAFVRMNPYWQEYDRWIDEDHDSHVDYIDPYWDNDVVKNTMQKFFQEAESIKKDRYDDEKFVYVEISYGDSFGDQLDTCRLFIWDLDTYEMWEFCFSEAVAAFREKEVKKE